VIFSFYHGVCEDFKAFHSEYCSCLTYLSFLCYVWIQLTIKAHFCILETMVNSCSLSSYNHLRFLAFHYCHPHCLSYFLGLNFPSTFLAQNEEKVLIISFPTYASSAGLSPFLSFPIPYPSLTRHTSMSVFPLDF
jgi:hypothetical protein